jgi:hypothetical protein
MEFVTEMSFISFFSPGSISTATSIAGREGIDQCHNRIVPSEISARKVQDIVFQLGIDQLSASSVSRLSKKLDEKVEEFLKKTD